MRNSRTLENVSLIQESGKKEPCVSCGKQTEYPVQMPIELRNWYIEGAGQLCEDCYTNIYDSKKCNCH